MKISAWVSKVLYLSLLAISSGESSAYVYILPFDNTQNDPALEWISTGLSDMTREEIKNIYGVRVKTREELVKDLGETVLDMIMVQGEDSKGLKDIIPKNATTTMINNVISAISENMNVNLEDDRVNIVTQVMLKIKKEMPSKEKYQERMKMSKKALRKILKEELETIPELKVFNFNPKATRTDMRALAFPAEDPLQIKDPDQLIAYYLWMLSEESATSSRTYIEYDDKL